MGITSIVLFFVYFWGFGFAVEKLIRARPANNFLEKNIMRIGIGVAALIITAMIFNVVGIPLDWKLFFVLAIAFPVAPPNTLICSWNTWLVVMEGHTIEKNEKDNKIPRNKKKYTLKMSLWSLNSANKFIFDFLAAWFASMDINLFKEGNNNKEVKAMAASPESRGNKKIADAIPIMA